MQASEVFTQAEIDRRLLEVDKVLELCRGAVNLSVRALPQMFEKRFGYSKTLHQIRLHVQILVDNGDLVRSSRGCVSYATSTPTE